MELAIKPMVNRTESLPRVQSDEGQDEKRPAERCIEDKIAVIDALGAMIPDLLRTHWAT